MARFRHMTGKITVRTPLVKLVRHAVFSSGFRKTTIRAAVYSTKFNVRTREAAAGAVHMPRQFDSAAVRAIHKSVWKNLQVNKLFTRPTILHRKHYTNEFLVDSINHGQDFENR